MKKTFFSALFLSISIFAFSQQNLSDSFFDIDTLPTLPNEKLDQLIEAYKKSNHAFSTYFRLKKNKGVDYQQQLLIVDSLLNYSEQFTEFEKFKLNTLKTEILALSGEVGKAADHAEYTIALLKKLPANQYYFNKHYNRLIYNIILRDFEIGESDRAFEQVNRLVDDLEKGKARNKSDEVAQLINIANILSKMSINDRALSLYLKSSKVANSTTDTIDIIKAYSSLSIGYAKANMVDSAIYVCQKSIELTKAIQDSLDLPGRITNLASLNYLAGYLEKSESLFQESFQLATRFNNDRIKNISRSNLLVVQSKLGKNSNANQLYEQSIDHYKKTNQYVMMMREMNAYADYLFKKQDYQSSAQYYQNAINALDSLRNDNYQVLKAELSNKMGLIEKENELLEEKRKRLETKLTNQRLIILFTVLAALGLLYFLFFRFKSKNTILTKERDKIEIEHRLLRSQMNPHFTYNALGSIQHFLLSDGQAEKGAYFLAKFSKLMRLILDQSQKSWIGIEEEKSTIENYLSLQKLRYNNKFSYQIDIDKNLIYNHIKIPPLLVQPLIENSLEHGKIHTIPKGEVSITYTLASQSIKVMVKDNGIGLKAANLAKRKEHESVATQIITRRIEHIAGTDSENYGLTYSTNHGETIATLLIPLNKR